MIELRPFDGTPDITAWLTDAAADRYAGGLRIYETQEDFGFQGCYIAWRDGEPVAWVVTGWIGHEVFVSTIVVAPEHRRQGVGLAVMHALTVLRDLDGGRVIAEIETGNPAGVEWCTAAGFTFSSRWTDDEGRETAAYAFQR